MGTRTPFDVGVAPTNNYATVTKTLNFISHLSRATELSGPLKPCHAEFLQTLMAEYRGTRLTLVMEIFIDLSSKFYFQVLDKVKTLPEETLQRFINEAR